jgi:GxxExxY protein
MTENDIAREVVDSAYRIHTTFGPGLLESVYDTVLAYELGRRGLRTVRQQKDGILRIINGLEEEDSHAKALRRKEDQTQLA